MPNWVSIRLNLSGPHAEIMRFRDTCIRTTSEEKSGKECLDLGALVPAPAVIEATREDRSAAAKQAAFNATGYEDWHDWRIAHWGCMWNTSNFQVVTATPDLIDVFFETAWSTPEPAFAALAAQFPLLSGQVCAVEESIGWGLISRFRAGSYTPTSVEVSAELAFLVYGWRRSDHVRLNTGRVLAEPSSDMQDPGDGVVERLWTGLSEALAPELMARLNFEIDVRRFNRWHARKHSMRGDDTPARQLHDVVRSPMNAAFLLAEGRCSYEIDRKLMSLLAEGLTAEWGGSPDAAQIESELRSDVTYLLSRYSEGELSEWAFRAIIQHKSGINFADQASLQESFMEYAMGLREQILQHLECVQAALMIGLSGQAELGRASDPLSSCVTLS